MPFRSSVLELVKTGGAALLARAVVALLAGAVLALPHQATAVQAPAPAANAKQTELLKLGGKVVDQATGAGVANATVIVQRVVDYKTDGVFTGYKIVAETRHTTAADGQFSFEITPRQIAEKTPKSSFTVLVGVEHPDYVPFGNRSESLANIRKAQAAGGPQFFERIELERGELVTGKVVGPEGRPAPGVLVSGRYRFNTQESEGGDDKMTPVASRCTTDAEGRYKLHAKSGEPFRIYTTTQEYVEQKKAIGLQRGEVGTLRLARGISVAGRVLAGDGKPLAGIGVLITSREPSVVNHWDETETARRAITDEAGRFVAPPLPAGEYYAVVQERFCDPATRERIVRPLPEIYLAEKIRLTEGAAATLELRPVAQATLRIRYVDSRGAATAVAEFDLSGKVNGVAWTKASAPTADGRCEVRFPAGLTEASLMVIPLGLNRAEAFRFRRKPGGPLEKFVNARLSRDLGTLNEDLLDFEIVRYHSPTLIVKVVDDAGRRIDNAAVVGHYLFKEPFQYGFGFHQHEKTADGDWKAIELLPDEDIRLFATAATFQTAGPTVRLVEGETREITIKLMRTADFWLNGWDLKRKKRS